MIDFTFKKVACSPPNITKAQPQQTGRYIGPVRQTLVAMTVMCKSGNYLPGDTVWVTGDGLKHAWASQVFTVEEKEIVLVPEELFVAVDLIDRPKEFSPRGHGVTSLSGGTGGGPGMTSYPSTTIIDKK